MKCPSHRSMDSKFCSLNFCWRSGRCDNISKKFRLHTRQHCREKLQRVETSETATAKPEGLNIRFRPTTCADPPRGHGWHHLLQKEKLKATMCLSYKRRPVSVLFKQTNQMATNDNTCVRTHPASKEVGVKSHSKIIEHCRMCVHQFIFIHP
jgi:hypothetical protein